MDRTWIRFSREGDVFSTDTGTSPRVYVVDLDQCDLDEDGLARLLPTEEVHEAARLRTAQLRRRRLAARAVLRTILGRWLAREPRELQIERTELGKPYMVGGPSFNLSHSGPLVLVAVRPSGRLGVDIEVRRHAAELEAIAHHFFHGKEWEELKKDPRGLTEAFHRTWVRKEALLKALGTGLHTPLHRFIVDTGVLAEGRNALRGMDIPGERPERWTIAPLQVAAVADAAVAWDEPRSIRT